MIEALAVGLGLEGCDCCPCCAFAVNPPSLRFMNLEDGLIIFKTLADK